MTKRVFIIHGWGGYPEEGWFPWLKTQLEQKGFQVFVPQLPQASEPRIKNWLPALTAAVGKANKNTFFVGHSMGCQAIARFVESLPQGAHVGGAVFVAGFFKRLTNLDPEEFAQGVAPEWLEAPLSLEKVKSHMPKSVAIFSDDDPYVPLDNVDDYEHKLGSKIVIEKNMGHFSGSDDVVELPVALDAVLGLADSK